MLQEDKLSSRFKCCTFIMVREIEEKWQTQKMCVRNIDWMWHHLDHWGSDDAPVPNKKVVVGEQSGRFQDGHHCV